MQSISHYRVEGELGRGGLGVVFRAVDIRLGRQVAIKVLSADATRDEDLREVLNWLDGALGAVK